MTIPEFLEKLRETEGPWNFIFGSMITCRDGCPISAVAGGTSKGYGVLSVAIAAQAIGLDIADALKIVAAADNVGAADPQLRAQLLAATVNR